MLDTREKARPPVRGSDIHPGAGGALADWQGSAKRWPIGQFIELSRRLVGELNATVLVFGGPDEEALQETGSFDPRRSPAGLLAVNESLKHTAALIRACDLMISNDSGLMHVAAALGVPTLGIFGPTNPSRTAPYGPRLPLSSQAGRAEPPRCGIRSAAPPAKSRVPRD